MLLNDTRIDRHHGCDAVVRTVHDLCAANGMEIVASAPAHHDWRENAAVLDALETADVVIVNGEGTIHHDRPAGRRLLEAGAWAQERGIASALVNMTWESNSANFAALLKRFDLVSVRESMSAAQVRAAGVDCLVVPDLALHHSWPSTRARAGVGFTDSVVGPVAAGMARLRRATGGQTVTIFHSHSARDDALRAARHYRAGPRSLSPVAVGAAAMRAISEHRAQVADLERFAGQIAGLRLLVTGRFHALILAFATGTPVLAVGSNSHKIEASLRDAGLDPFRMTAPEAVDRSSIERACGWHGDEKARLDAFVADGRSRIADLFRRIRDLVP